MNVEDLDRNPCLDEERSISKLIWCHLERTGSHEPRRSVSVRSSFQLPTTFWRTGR